MTSELEGSRGELVEANLQLDERRRFTETVLEGVSAGVVGLDSDGVINLPNRSASELLGIELDEMIGQYLGQVVPEMAPLLDPQQKVKRAKIPRAKSAFKRTMRRIHSSFELARSGRMAKSPGLS